MKNEVARRIHNKLSLENVDDRRAAGYAQALTQCIFVASECETIPPWLEEAMKIAEANWLAG